MRSMDLQSVESGGIGPPSRRFEGCNNLTDLRFRQLFRHTVIAVKADSARGKRLSYGGRALSAGVVDLKRNFGAVCMAGIHDPFQSSNLVVIPDAKVVVREPALRGYTGRLHNDQPYSSQSSGGIVAQMKRRWNTVRRCLIHTHRRHNDSVLKSHTFDFVFFKQFHDGHLQIVFKPLVPVSYTHLRAHET